MNTKFKYVALLLSLFAALFSSCDRNAVIDEHVSFPENRWDMNNVVKLEADITDTITPYNLYFNIRNSGGYSFSNIFIFFNTYTPDGKMARDTVELTLADERGNWLGDGMGDIWDNRILFRKNFRFPVTGTYRFELEQAMRVNPLPGIMDAGIRIEKTGNE